MITFIIDGRKGCRCVITCANAGVYEVGTIVGIELLSPVWAIVPHWCNLFVVNRGDRKRWCDSEHTAIA
jgi:hypothetical protein